MKEENKEQTHEMKQKMHSKLICATLIHMRLLQCQKGSTDGNSGIPETLHCTEHWWAAAQHSCEGHLSNTAQERGGQHPWKHTFYLTLERDSYKKQLSIPKPSS